MIIYLKDFCCFRNKLSLRPESLGKKRSLTLFFCHFSIMASNSATAQHSYLAATALQLPHQSLPNYGVLWTAYTWTHADSSNSCMTFRTHFKNVSNDGAASKNIVWAPKLKNGLPLPSQRQNGIAVSVMTSVNQKEVKRKSGPPVEVHVVSGGVNFVTGLIII